MSCPWKSPAVVKYSSLACTRCSDDCKITEWLLKESYWRSIQSFVLMFVWNAKISRKDWKRTMRTRVQKLYTCMFWGQPIGCPRNTSGGSVQLWDRTCSGIPPGKSEPKCCVVNVSSLYTLIFYLMPLLLASLKYNNSDFCVST
eukprot:gene9746-3084_t